MSKNQQEEAVVREYAVDECPPPEARHYGFWDLFLTFIGGNANASTWYVGGCIASLGFMGALGVSLIANPIAYLCMGALGYMGYKIGTTSMGLARVPLGIRGSKVPSVALLFPYLGWCACNTYIAAISISYILNAVTGMPAYGMEGDTVTMLIGIFLQSAMTIGAVIIGGSRSVKIFERVSGILLVALTIIITFVVFTTFNVADIISWKPPAEVSMPLGLGIDNILAFSLAWVTCLAEFTRYTRKPSTAVASPVLGATFSMVWFTLVGTVSTIAVAVSTGMFDPNASDPSTVVTQLGFGWIALVVLILTTVTTNVINLFVGVQAFENIAPKARGKVVTGVLSALMVLISLIPMVTGSFLDAFQVFLGYLGAVFPPIGTIIIVDYFIMRRDEYDIHFLSKRNGPYWYSNGINWCGMLALIFGAVIYFVFGRIGWMMDTLGAVAYSMIATAVVYALLCTIGKRNGYIRSVDTFRTGND